MPHFRRARWGLRRTFQTEQAIEELSIYENVAMVHEHPGAAARPAQADALAAIEFVGLETDPDGAGSARSACASGVSSRSRARSSASRASCCSTSPRPACRTRRPSTSASVIRADPRAHRRAGDPRRPRHEARLGVLRGHRGARLRRRDRLRADGGGTARRGGHARVPRHRGGSTSAAPARARRARALRLAEAAAAGRDAERPRLTVGARATATSSPTSRSRSRRARSPRCSDPTAPASRASSSPSAACCARSAAPSWLGARDLTRRAAGGDPPRGRCDRAGRAPAPARVDGRGQPARRDLRGRPPQARDGPSARSSSSRSSSALGLRAVALRGGAADGRARPGARRRGHGSSSSTSSRSGSRRWSSSDSCRRSRLSPRRAPASS